MVKHSVNENDYMSRVLRKLGIMHKQNWGELSFDWGELSNIFGATCPDFRGDLSWGELALGRVVWLPNCGLLFSELGGDQEGVHGSNSVFLPWSATLALKELDTILNRGNQWDYPAGD
ncbi:hypothetical protein DPMN_028893 [Dreissena polymorpha]|uniref:Uncharacterized protein n=1 Tax=Dreissena polymorpha TaxID=45954 RepID=A0A9D4LXR5_DREPO|nr:hypothetical protein DPMN_028893 [Dreissena polymorpha]